ncbi:MAG TPA: hypothetical protein VNN22_24855 [Verrucomicrobiae bacterium]|nr:hypothetical protein [Verrucomicrobiae bacterium]
MKRIFFRICVLFFALIVISFIIWRVNLGHEVSAKFAAIRAVGLPTNGNELNDYYPTVPDNENAALVMTQAFVLLQNYPGSRSNEVDRFQFPERGQHLTNDQVQLLTGYVEMNSNTLAKVSEAIKLSKSRYPVDFSPGFETLLRHLDEVKELALLCEYRAALAIDSSQPANADVSVKEILGIARTLNEEPTLISQLVRFALVRIGIATLENRFNSGELNNAELTNLAGVFTQQKETNFIARGLIGERAMAVSVFRPSLAKMKQQLSNFEAPQDESPAPQRSSQLLKATGIFERDLNFYLEAMETNISFAKLPPPQSMAITNISEKMAETARGHYCIFSTMLLPAMSGSVIKEADSFARVRLATTAIAIERFRLARGKLLENLNELTPQFLTNVPNDPFAGEPLLYHRLAKGYVIYSVGRDGHDDGGRERPRVVKSTDKTSYDITFIAER